MPKITIEISELRDKGDGETVKDFAEFLEDRVNAKIKVAGGEITIDYEEEKAPSKAHLRVLIRKFLHQVELKEYFRVISSNENSFTIKEKKRAMEE